MKPDDDLAPTLPPVVAPPARRGRPKGSKKEQVALRLDRDIIQHFKEGGAGWQSRINAALKELIR